MRGHSIIAVLEDLVEANEPFYASVLIQICLVPKKLQLPQLHLQCNDDTDDWVASQLTRLVVPSAFHQFTHNKNARGRWSSVEITDGRSSCSSLNWCCCFPELLSAPDWLHLYSFCPEQYHKYHSFIENLRFPSHEKEHEGKIEWTCGNNEFTAPSKHINVRKFKFRDF